LHEKEGIVRQSQFAIENFMLTENSMFISILQQLDYLKLKLRK